MNISTTFIEKRIAWIGLILFLSIYYGLLIWYQGNAVILSDVLEAVGELLSLGLICAGIRHLPQNRKMTWGILALGILSYFIGDCLWAGSELLYDIEVKSPSVCDIFYVLSSFCYLVALATYIYKVTPLNMLRTGFDVGISIVASTTLIIKYVILPISANTSMDFWEKTVSLFYPVMDIGYLTIVFSLLLFSKRQHRNTCHALLGLSFLCFFIADQLFLIYSNYYYVSGGFLDPLWPAGTWLLALSSFYPIQTAPSRPRTYNLIWNYFCMILPYLFIGMLIILLSYEYILIDPLVAGMALTIVLIILRQILVLHQNAKLVRIMDWQNKKLNELNQQKEAEANTDFLTALCNRRYINDKLQQITSHDQNLSSLSIMLIDIDFFKQINDTYGHQVGDIVLQRISACITASIRQDDTAGRFGGDEFIILLPDTTPDMAGHVAARLRQSVANEDFNCPGLTVRLSIGIASWNNHCSTFDIDEILRQADAAMYADKNNAR